MGITSKIEGVNLYDNASLCNQSRSDNPGTRTAKLDVFETIAQRLTAMNAPMSSNFPDLENHLPLCRVVTLYVDRNPSE